MQKSRTSVRVRLSRPTSSVQSRHAGLRNIPYQPPHLFEDVQIKGPFRSWRHRHIINAHPEGATLRDKIEYEPPLGILGRMFAPLLIEKRLRKLFDYRHRVTRE